MTDLYVSSVFHQTVKALPLIERLWDWAGEPLAVLTSFAHIRGYYRKHSVVPGIRPRRHMLDSGAFSAWQSGYTIDIDALIVEAHNDTWDEVVALDVVGDPDASRLNAEYMWSKGVVAMPVFHIGDPWDLLDYYCRYWPKVGLSCLFGEPRRQSLCWMEQCFARQWPHRFHSFGWTAESLLRRLPFESADTASWANGPGRWARHMVKQRGRHRTASLPGMSGGRHLGYGAIGFFRYYRRLEQELAVKWSPQLREARGVG